MSRSPLDIDDLVEHWTLLPDELDLVVRLHEPSRLVFAVWLKFYTRLGRFPRGRGEVHDDAVAFVARQLKVSTGDLSLVEWQGRTAERHRATIRAHLGFRECSTADAEKLVGWLAAEVACKERRFELVREELLGECRRERIEPPADARVERIVRSALHQAEEALCALVRSRLPAEVADRLEGLAEGADDGPSLLATIKSVPGSVSLDSMLAEIDKLRAVRAVGVPAAALADVAPKVVAGWRARAMVEAPSHLARHTSALRLTLLAALLRLREREITDALVELPIATVHRIDARAQRKLTNELIAEFKKVTGKENLLFRIAEASLTAPESLVRDVVFPAVSGGEQTLRDVVAEFHSKGPTYRRTAAGGRSTHPTPNTPPCSLRPPPAAHSNSSSRSSPPSSPDGTPAGDSDRPHRAGGRPARRPLTPDRIGDGADLCSHMPGSRETANRLFRKPTVLRQHPRCKPRSTS